jgi:polysaccharide biosynthesis protein PslF
VIAFGVLSTYPPTRCGIATFSAALVRHLNTPGSRSSAAVVRIGDDVLSDPTPPEVVAEVANGSRGGAAVAAAALNRFDVAVVQHEYGIYGGPDGGEVLDVLDRVRVPVVVVLHTVLASPTIWQRGILSRICHAADAIVVPSQTAASRLLQIYGVDSHKITMIPHGAETETWLPHHNRRRSRSQSPLLLTWGLLGPGKGIEWVIDALAEVQDLPTPPRYLVAGETHPKILERHGESYRNSLRERAEALGIGHLVEFDPSYRSRQNLAALAASAEAVVLPYDSTEQVVSGVLTETVAARRPVIATRFPHAAELLADGAGLLVPHRDPRAISVAIRRVLTEPGLAESMEWRAGVIAPTLAWEAVADRYRLLATRLTTTHAPRTTPPGPVGHGRPRIGRRTTVG